MRLLLIISLLMLAGTSISLSQEKKNTKPASSRGTDDNCMLHVGYDTPMGVNSHLKGTGLTKISVKPTDYIQFNKNGTYSESIDGQTCNGTWGYNYDTHTVSINCNGVRSFKVSQKGNTIELSSPTESFKLTPKN